MLTKLSSAVLGMLSTVAFAMYLPAQQAEPIPAAPVPPAIMNAKTVFISNGGQEANYQMVQTGWYSGGPNRPYNQLYAAIKSWGKFEIVASPAEADVVFEIAFDNRVAEMSQFKLVILDPKMHVTLWTVTKNIELAGRVKNREKNYDLAMEALVDDLKAVAGVTSVPAQK